MYAHERSLVKRLEDKPFALLGVNSDTDKDALKKAMEKEHITWRSFWNGPEGTGGPISTKWNVHGWPTTVRGRCQGNDPLQERSRRSHGPGR